jgi:lipopolysaccharide transport system ATP-binding protein
LTRAFSAPFGVRQTPTSKTLWALRNLDFSIEPQELLGVIGRNGAGKSTLLKVLSRITRPTEGTFSVEGRLCSLLEIGTGFHPELTGRENIFLNGAILGMKRREIGRKFDAIVSFAGTEAFLDTPVKRYSSGMYVRLAFAIAAHLEPEILLLDEVLSVGDMSFREKCFRHLHELRKSGTTIILVSHYLSQVSVLTKRCIWLDKGAIRQDGPTDAVLAAYANELRMGSGSADQVAIDRGEQETTGLIEFSAVRTEKPDGTICNEFAIGEDLQIALAVSVNQPVECPWFAVTVHSHDGIKILNLVSSIHGGRIPAIVGRDGTVRLRLRNLPLLAGDYVLSASIGIEGSNSATHASWPQCHQFSVLVTGRANAQHFVYMDPFNGTGIFHWAGEWMLPWA